MPLYSTGDNSVGISKAYAEFAKTFGDLIILSPNSFVKVDLLILPGGKDLIDGGAGDYSFYNSDGERFLEHFDRNTLPKYIEAGIPIYGICRGFQSLMKHFGVPLIQDIYWNHGLSKDTADLKAHKVKYTIQARDYINIDKAPKEMGSWHHQGVFVKDIPESMTVISYADDSPMINNCLVEHFIHNNLPIAGTQSHPERSFNSVDFNLINRLLA